MAKQPSQALKTRVLSIVESIPNGKIVTYGDIANHTGLIARTVGWIMASLNEEQMGKYPWHRVVGSGGTIPALKYGFRGNIQIELLKEENVVFKPNNQIKEFSNYRHNLD